ncbi:hypothetical protein [Shewanella chilikensis]|uniref:hypothetical protein n=1 Tax=Shewanella chilikensis TaxID=558541 RepID=UPI003A9750DD
MSKFNELHEHLKECVDSDNESFVGITEDGVEFNMYEWAFGLSVQAKNENDKLVDALNAITRDYIQLAESGDAGCWTPDDVEAIVNARNLLKELGHEI